MSIYSSRRKSRRASRSQLGHLKLSVHEDSSALIIHVYEGRGLMRREGAPLDTYIKLYLLPDPQKLSKQKSRTLKQKDPIFNDKFTYVFDGSQDLEKRLFISVWTHCTAARNDMIGCMSFKIADILGPDKGLNGWYQLLDDERGQIESHRVPVSIAPPYDHAPKTEPGVKTFAVTLVRSERGYGFSVDGRSPVHISFVKPGMPAAEADMRIGDRIIEVEGTDVTRASADLVVTIFKKCPEVIHLILQRPPVPILPKYSSNSLRRPPKKSSQKQQFHSQLSLNRPRQHRASLPPSQALVPEHPQATRRSSAPFHDTSLTQPDFPGPIAENHRWSSTGIYNSSQQLGTLGLSLHESFGAGALTQPTNDVSAANWSLTQPDEREIPLRQGLTGEDSAYSFSLESQAEDGQPVDWESLGFLGHQRQKAVNNLYSTQNSLCEELKDGLDGYVEPLKSVIPSESHGKIFNGLIQLHDVSCSILTKLTARKTSYKSPDSTPVSMYIETLADIYWIHLRDLVEAMKVTIGNCAPARQEIANCFACYPEFSRLVEDSVVKDKKKSIYSFVEVVNDYLPKLTRSMFALVFFTPLSHDDQKHLHGITDELMGMCRDKELVTRWKTEQENMQRLQLCVSFGSKIKGFRLSIPGRLLLQEGELTLVERRKKRKVWVLLFTDVLLVTSRRGKVLSVIEQPLPLHTLTVQDFHCADANEIQISTVSGGWSRLLRAGNEKEKEVWLNKIKERAIGSRATRRKIDKGRLQPRIQDALRRQSQQIQASAVANDQSNAVLTVVQEVGVASRGVSETDAPTDSQPLKRGTSKRRSLFNVGRKSTAEDRESRRKRSFRGRPPPAPARTTLQDVSVEVLKKWKISFDTMIKSQDGLQLFEEFLKSEFSEENIQFWKSCERFKTVPPKTLASEARAINEEYILQRAPKWVNLDHQTVKEIEEKLPSPDHSMFLKAQHQIFILMQRDSFKRFIDSEKFQTALKR